MVLFLTGKVVNVKWVIMRFQQCASFFVPLLSGVNAMILVKVWKSVNILNFFLLRAELAKILQMLPAGLDMRKKKDVSTVLKCNEVNVFAWFKHFLCMCRCLRGCLLAKWEKSRYLQTVRMSLSFWLFFSVSLKVETNLLLSSQQLTARVSFSDFSLAFVCSSVNFSQFPFLLDTNWVNQT